MDEVPQGGSRSRFKDASKIIERDFFNDVLFIDVTICLYIELLKYITDLAAIINIIPDILNFSVFILMIRDIIDHRIKIDKWASSIFAFLFMVWITSTGFFLEGSITDRYYRYRYIFFGFLVYHICIHYMTEKYWKRLSKFLYMSQIIHTVLVTYQFAVLHTRVDMTNGIFGSLGYNNASHGLFCLIMSMIGAEGFLKKDLSKRQSVAMILMACYSCALAEIKAFYVLFLFGVVLILLFDHKDKCILRRMLLLILLGSIGLLAAFFILFKIMPENMYAFAGVGKWVAYESYETGRAGGMGRMTQIQYIYSRVFDHNAVEAFVGKGLGADISWVPYELGKLFLNFGILGSGLFFFFLLTRAAGSYRYRKKVPESMVSMVMCILTIPCMVVWNATLNRMAMLLFVILAIGPTNSLKQTKGR